MDMGKNPKFLCVGGMSAQEILIGTPILHKYLQNSIVLTKNKSSDGRIPTKMLL